MEAKISFLEQVRRKPTTPMIEDLATILQQCRKERNVALALYLHSNMCEVGLDSHKSLGNYLVSLLVEVRSVCHAQQVFDKLAFRNECSWSSLIIGYVNCGKPQQAIVLYKRMLKVDSSHASEFAFVALLKACIDLKDMETGHVLFAEIARQGLMERNVFIGSTLVDMYANFGALAMAQEVCDKLTIRNVVSWNALISGYTDHGRGEEALSCLEKMWHDGICPDAVTLVCSLKACGSIVSLSKGNEIYTQILKKGMAEDSFFVGSSLVMMYIKCGALAAAREVFDKLPVRNTIIWNALISGYAENSHGEEALDCLKQMQCEGFSPDDVTLVCTLKCCCSLGSVSLGQEVHADAVMKGMERNPLVGSSLIDMHAKCGSLASAQNVFDNLPLKDVVAWTALIAGYVAHGDSENALHVFASMQSEKLSPGVVTYFCVLEACRSKGAKSKGQEMHAEAIKKGLEGEPLVSRSVVDLYAKCGLLREAHYVFDMLPIQDRACWSALIVAYVEQGLGVEALRIFKHMQQEGITSDVVTLVCGLKACGVSGAINEGKQLHADLCKKGLEREPFAGSTLADMYAKCGSFADAEEAMDKTVASWNALISGYVEHGHDEEALNCLKQMQQEGFSEDAITFIFSLKACCSLGVTGDGQKIHMEIVTKGLEMEFLISNTLVDTYAKCDLRAEALHLFYKCPYQTVVLWTAVIAGLIEHGHGEQALYLFGQMQSKGIPPSAATFSCILKACGSMGAMDRGEELFTEIVKRGMLEENISLGGTLVDMYAKQGFLAKAQAAFNDLPVQDAVSWTALIAGYAEHGAGEMALNCFEQMQQEGVPPLVITFVSVLKACGRVGAMDKGQAIHSEIARKGLEREPYIGNTLVDLYAKCSLPTEARQLLNSLPARNAVSWMSLIKGYTEHGSCEEVIKCFEQLQLESISQGAAGLVGSLKACASIVAIARGREAHADVAKKGLEKELLVGNTLVDMYAKCGSLAEAEDTFGKLVIRDVVSWTSLIIGYSQVGMSENVIRVYDKMVTGVRPDSITFISVLNAFSHTGLVDKGQMYFETMSNSHGLVPNLEHYTCLVDLLSRAGLVEKAILLIKEMPVHPGIVVWLTVLGACRKWGYLDFGRDAFEHAVKLDEKDSAPYVCMANIYVDAAMEIDI